MDHRQTEDRAWERLLSAFKFGDCLVTISTSDTVTEQQEQVTGLVREHAYAVLDIREAGILRMIKLKNPWARRPWKGRFSTADTSTRWTDGLKHALGVSSMAQLHSLEKQGVFWIEFSDVRQYFKSFFLNCKSYLFVYCNNII